MFKGQTIDARVFSEEIKRCYEFGIEGMSTPSDAELLEHREPWENPQYYRQRLISLYKSGLAMSTEIPASQTEIFVIN